MKFNPFSNLKRSVSFATACLLLAGLVLIPACQNPADDMIPAHAESVSEIDISKAMNQAAPAMAEMLNDNEVRNLVKTLAMEQFDGDYDILYRDIATKQLQNGETFGQRFTTALAAKVGSEEEAVSLINMIPRFQVAVPVNIESWDADAFIPAVAVNPLHLDDTKLESITGYNADGTTTTFSGKVDPSVPVIVLGVSERTNDDGSIKEQYQGFISQDDIRSRYNGENEKLQRFKILNLNALEGWVAGKPEMRVNVLGSRATGTASSIAGVGITTKYYNPKRNQVNNTWYTVNTSLFNWKTEYSGSYSSVYGDEIRLVWIEEDSGTKVELGFNIGGKIKLFGSEVSVGVTPKITFEDKDDQAGDAVVDFNDSKYIIYSTGLLQFDQS